jgi:hypothetical protein
MGNVSTSASAVLDHFLIISQLKGGIGFAWGKGKTIEEAKCHCKKNGGNLRSKKAWKCTKDTFVDDWGSAHFPCAEARPIEIKRH